MELFNGLVNEAKYRLDTNCNLTVDSVWRTYGHKRTTELLLLSSPWGLVAILTIAWVMVTIVGPQLGHLKFDAKPFMLVYNGFIFGTLGMGIPVALNISNFAFDSFECNAFDPNSSQLKVISGQHMGYVLLMFKFLDFGVPFFDAVQGKDSSILYPLHISATTVLIYLGLAFYPGGLFLLPAVGDCVYHCLLYAYLALSTTGQRWRPVRRFRKFIIFFRVFTLAVGIVHASYAYLSTPPSCGPSWLILSYALYTILSTVMFTISFRNTKRRRV